MFTIKLGMTLDQSDHRRYVLRIDGRPVVRTFVSTGTKYKTLDANLIALMAKQLQIPVSFFVGLVQCSKTRDDYVAYLRDTGVA